MERTGGYSDAGAHELLERDHELRSGIEALAFALNEQRDRLPSGDVDQLALVVVALLDNARVHAAPSAIDFRATSPVVLR